MTHSLATRPSRPHLPSSSFLLPHSSILFIAKICHHLFIVIFVHPFNCQNMSSSRISFMANISSFLSCIGLSAFEGAGQTISHSILCKDAFQINLKQGTCWTHIRHKIKLLPPHLINFSLIELCCWKSWNIFQCTQCLHVTPQKNSPEKVWSHRLHAYMKQPPDWTVLSESWNAESWTRLLSNVFMLPLKFVLFKVWSQQNLQYIFYQMTCESSICSLDKVNLIANMLGWFIHEPTALIEVCFWTPGNFQSRIFDCF